MVKKLKKLSKKFLGNELEGLDDEALIYIMNQAREEFFRRRSKLVLNLLTEEEKAGIKSCAIYWNEVKERENGEEILQQEAQAIIRRLGSVKVMWIIEAYALNN